MTSNAVSPHSQPVTSGIPLVIQVGFAGSRNFIDNEAFTAAEASQFDLQLTQYLTARLERLNSDLHTVGQPYFFCGISQLAVGADTIFTGACQASRIPQRILLPEPFEDYLNAVSPTGVADFSQEHRQIARELLKSSHIINHRVVSTAESRSERFEDVNLEIVRISDITVCMVRSGIEHKRGGTQDLIDRARQHGRPVLEISVALDGRRLLLSETWHGLGNFKLPTLPRALRNLRMASLITHLTVPSPADYLHTLKSFTSAQAKERSRSFFIAALIIIASHVGATVSAVISLQNREQLIVSLLIVELLLLPLGFATHHYMRRSEPSHIWAVSRLVAETTRSVGALSELRAHLAYLFSLPFPSDIWPLLRTLDVLHLASANAAAGRPWQVLRTAYLRDRLTGTNAQLGFYERKCADSIRWLLLARWSFFVFWVGAFVAAFIEFLQACHHLPREAARLDAWCGPLAIVLPVLAVGALSLAAAFDLEARAQTFNEMLSFLRRQMQYIENATSEKEFADLILETESRLLGETVSWLSRRSFTEVA
jgi:hypothetical protein